MKERERILLRLMQASDAIQNIQLDLNKLPWDSDKPLVTLTRPDIMRVLGRFINEELNENEVEAWANAIEGREDIDFEIGYEELLSDVIHQLANPLLTVRLTSTSAHEMLDSLG